jgi:hypothetical protein
VSESRVIKSFQLPHLVALFTAVTICTNVLTLVAVSLLETNDSVVIKSVYGQLDPSTSSPEEIREQAEDFLSTLMELQNQSGAVPSFDEDLDNSTGVITETELAEEQFATDVNGRYNNSAYGVLDFVLPEGWYGSEKQWSGDKSISLDMHPGTEAEFMDRLMTPPAADSKGGNDIITTMTLESKDKAQMQYTQSLLDEISPVSETGEFGECESLDGTTKLLQPNSTSIIGGKSFNITTTECTYSSDESRTKTTEVMKTYEHESPQRIYTLQLKVYKDSFSVDPNSPPVTIDIQRYSPIIDNAIQTLKIE